MKPQRLRPPSPPPSRHSHVQGSFTRSRSQSLLRCTRYGPKTPYAFAPLPGARGCVKDLRLRRIFSPQASSQEGFLARMAVEEGEGEVMGKRDGGGVEVDLERVEECDSVGKRYSGVGACVDEASDKDKTSAICEAATKEDDGVGEGILRSSEVEGTPPDWDGVSEPETTQGTEMVEQDSRGKQGKARNSRLRLFWNSSSHCYRRLLPFLMDITKNSSSTLEILPCQNVPAKVDKVTANKPSTPLSSSLPYEGTDASTEHHGVLSQTEQLIETQALQNSENENMILEDSVSLASSPGESMNASAEQHEIGVTDLSESKQLIKTQVHMRCSENETLILEDPMTNGQDTEATPIDSCSSVVDHSPGSLICEYNLLCNSEHSPPIDREPLSVEDLVGCTSSHSDFHHSSRSISQDQQLATSIVEMDEKPHPKTVHSGNIGPAQCNTVAPLRSILKRQRRGCRGTCTCLDCTSFLFNAEKAFEFSKKQLLEAEDVALGLMKELSSLRRMLVASVVPMRDSKNRAVLQLNQVQEIYRRASRAEDLARFRLKEMVSELGVHCRTTNAPHSRVTFAGTVEVKKILPELAHIN